MEVPSLTSQLAFLILGLKHICFRRTGVDSCAVSFLFSGLVSQFFFPLCFQREKQERQQQQRTVKAKLREKRQVSARARRYYDEYELRMRARMLKRRTREEQVSALH